MVRKKGEKEKFWMLDRKCIGRTCFAPGHFQHRGGSPDSLTCMNNAYHGCPDDKDTLYSIESERERKGNGWKNV
jgi:hypothetical protein